MIKRKRLRTAIIGATVNLPEIVEGWTHQDNDCAWSQGWSLWRKHTKLPYEITFHTKKGRANFERGLRMKRRLQVKACIAVGRHQLGGNW